MNRFTGRDWAVLICVIAVAFSAAFALSRVTASGSRRDLNSTDWLLGIRSEDERARMLQRQLRGFDLAMWEVGARFSFLHEALVRKNYDLALYQWDKIEVSIRNALVRRPGKAAHAEQFLLGRPFEGIRDDLAARSSARAWDAFARAKVACQSCHGVEGVSYVNSQAVFELAPPDVRPTDTR